MSLSTPIRERIATFVIDSPMDGVSGTESAERVVLAAFPDATYTDFAAGLLIARARLQTSEAKR